MTIDDIDAAVAAIETVRNNPCESHSRAEALYHAFVEHVAQHANLEIRNMAQHVLKTQIVRIPGKCA
jgi:hypothetical protein